jgi:hypothetical protein
MTDNDQNGEVPEMLTGRFAKATLRCAARGEMEIQTALEQAMPHCPEHWEWATEQLLEARRLTETRSGVELGRATQIIAEVVDRAREAAQRPGEDGVA